MNSQSNPLHVLVAGGAGYIGSVVSAMLVEGNFRVTVLDSLVSGYREALHPDVTFVHGNVADTALVRDICASGIDVAMHFAAFIEVGESVADPSKYYLNNFTNAIAFVDALRSAGVGRMVFSSTAAVYGEPERIPLDETSALRPESPYGASKMTVERALRDYDRAYGFKSVSFRYFNAGGAFGSYGEDHHPESHLIPLVINAGLTGKPLKVFGADYQTRDGSCIRDYIHVRDLAEAHILAAQHLADGGDTDCFNLGTGTGFTVLEVIAEVEKVMGRPIPHEITDRRPGDTAELVASPAKAQAVLGWSPKLSTLNSIIASAWEWKQRHPEGYGA